jgi:hypothetical protein
MASWRAMKSGASVGVGMTVAVGTGVTVGAGVTVTSTAAGVHEARRIKRMGRNFFMVDLLLSGLPVL